MLFKNKCIRILTISFIFLLLSKSKTIAMYSDVMKSFSEKMYNRCISDFYKNNIEISDDSKNYCHCYADGIYNYFANNRELFYSFSDIIARQKLGYKITDSERIKIKKIKEYFDKNIIDVCLKKQNNYEEIKDIQIKKYIDDMEKSTYNMCMENSTDYPKYYKEKACKCMSETFKNEFKILYHKDKKTFENFLLLSVKFAIMQENDMSKEEKIVYDKFSSFYENVIKKVKQYCAR